MIHRVLVLSTLALVGACKAAPAPECPECVCVCPEAAAAPALQQPTRPPVAPRLSLPRREAPPPQGKRARGPVSVRPGTGTLTERTEAERGAMTEVFQGFLQAAQSGKLKPVAPFLTERLNQVLQKNAVRYEARFFRGLDVTVGALASGLEIGETRDSGSGNIEALFRFGDGHERRVIFFLEAGSWKLNRL